jgi:hypothetical protein
MALDICGEGSDGGAGNSHIIDGYDSVTRKANEAERIRGKGEESIKKAQLIKGVVPCFPETSDRMWLDISRCIQENGYQKLQSRRIYTMSIRPIKGFDNTWPTEFDVLH